MPPHDCNAEQYKALRKKFLADYDRRVPKLRQANHCIGCNHCVQHCPQSINIPTEMRKVDEFVQKLEKDIHKKAEGASV
jgi:predicted aldo/keto reductase-like oxidoreductase